MRTPLLTRSRAVITLLAVMAMGGCGSEKETPSENTQPGGIKLTFLRTLEHGNDAGALAFSPDGRTLATGGEMIGAEGTVKLWSTSGWTETASFSAFFRTVYSLAFTADSTRLAGSGFEPGAGVKLWQLPSARLLWSRERSQPLSLAMSPDGRQLAVCGGDGQIEMVTLADGALARSFTAHRFAILSLAFSGDGKYLVSGGGGDRLVKLWRAPAFGEEAVFSGSGAAVWSVAASPDGRYVASGTLDSLVRLWRTGDHSLAATAPQSAWIWSVAFSPDGQLLATAGDAGVYLYRVSDTLEQVATASVRASDVQFSPDGRILAATLADNIEMTPGSVTIWSVDR